MDWTYVLIGAGAGAVVLFLWKAIAWMALPHHAADYRSVPNEDAFVEALHGLKPIDGYYVIPHGDAFEKGLADPALAERMKKGPNAFLCVIPPGPPMTGGTFLGGFAINFFEGLGCAILLSFVAASVPSLVDKVMFFGGLGLFVSGVVYLTLVNWANHPRRFALTNIFDVTIGYALIGVVLHFVGTGA